MVQDSVDTATKMIWDNKQFMIRPIITITNSIEHWSVVSHCNRDQQIQHRSIHPEWGLADRSHYLQRAPDVIGWNPGWEFLI